MNEERGQTLILVLILLFVGAMILGPLSQITGIVLKNRTLHEQFIEEDYAIEAALRYGLWRLNWEPGFAASLLVGVESPEFPVTVNDVTAWATITAQAPEVELEGQELMKKGSAYQVIKQVDPPTANPGEETSFTYAVAVKSYDPAGSPLEKIVDILPLGLAYVGGNWPEEEWGLPYFAPQVKSDRPVWYGGSGWLRPWSHLGKAKIENKENPIEGNYHLELKGHVEDVERGYVKRSVDLPENEENVSLQFWAKTKDFEIDDEAQLLIRSYGDPTWTTVKTWDDSDTSYTQYIIDLHDLSSPFWIAFQADMDNDRDKFYVDDLRLVLPGDVTLASENFETVTQELTWDFKKDGRVPVPFDYGEVKPMIFSVTGTLPEGVWGNDISTTPGIKETITQAHITVGNPDNPASPRAFLDIAKTSDPPVIYPDELNTITYTVILENMDTVPVVIQELGDWLPRTGSENKDTDEVFRYVDNSTTAKITHTDMSETEVPIPDTYEDQADILEQRWKRPPDARWELKWRLDEHQDAQFNPIFLQPGEVFTMEFQTTVNPIASGSYNNEFLVDCTRYPLDVTVDWTTEPSPLTQGQPADAHFTVTVENVDVEEVEIKEIKKAFLPSTDTGVQDEAFRFDRITNASITHEYGDITNITAQYLEDDGWDAKKRRWKAKGVREEKLEIFLQPGDVLTIEFDATVVRAGDPYNELVWEMKLPEQREYDLDLYSFPTAGVVVPMYDLTVETLSSILHVNARLGSGNEIIIHSWHWKKHR